MTVMTEQHNDVAMTPQEPTTAAPGSMEKVLTLRARYAAGMPLWNDEDRNDHGPRQQTDVAAGLMTVTAGAGADHDQPIGMEWDDNRGTN